MARAPDPSSHIDAAFARFVRNGDPDALAQVFDRTAPRLILVAIHLVGNATDAEDLVQTTFLEAIRGAQRFTPGRPVMPWLASILAHRAANHRRARSRAPAPLDPDLGLASKAPPPDGEAAMRETVERLTDAIEDLPAPLREVVALRLLHGLRPAEIARALDRPIGTVHSQLHRGLGRLRAALPVALGLLIGAGVSRRGLAAVRDAVLSHAPGRSVSLAAPVIGGLLVKKLLVVATVLAAALLALSWPRGSVPEPQGTATAASRAPAGGVAGAAHGQEKPSPQRNEPNGGARNRHLVGSPRAVITGRVVAAETGRPLSGARVALWGYAAYGNPLPSVWRDPKPVRTGRGGRYRIAFRPHPEVGLSFRIDAPDRVVVKGGWIHLRADAAMDHGDVPMQRGTSVQARVLDEQGRPVADYELWLQGPSLDHGYRYGLRAAGWEGMGTLASDADGLWPRTRLVAGPWRVTEQSRGRYEFVGPRAIEIAAGEPGREITFRVRRSDPRLSIAGRVLDEAARPLPGVRLSVTGGPGSRNTTSKKDGAFSFGSLDPKRSPYALTIYNGSRHRRYALIEPRAPVAIATTDLHVILHRRARAHLRLEVRREDGGPVTRFAFACVPCTHDGGQTSLHGSPRLGEMSEHAGGLAVCEFLPGSYLLLLRAQDKALAPVLGTELEFAEGQTRTEHVVLARRRTWTARVVDKQSAFIKGARVSLLRKLGRGTVRSGHPTNVEDLLGRGVHSTRATLVIARTTTDTDGAARLTTGPDLGTAEILVESDHYLPARVAIGPRAPRTELRVTLRRAGIVEGVLHPTAIARAWGPTAEQLARAALRSDGDARIARAMPGIHLTREGSEQDLAAKLGFDGRFRLTSVPPGDWHVEFACTVWGSGTGMGRRLPLGEVRGLRPGETRRLELEAAQLLPAFAEGSVSLDGLPVHDAAIWLGSRTHIDASGRFATRALLARRYRPFLLLSDSPRAILGEREIELAAGKRVELHLTFLRRTLRVRLFGANGAPVAGRRVSLRVGATDSWRFRHLGEPRTTDEKGSAVFELVPPLPLDVLLWHQDIPPSRSRLRDDKHARLLGRTRAQISQVEAEVRFSLRR